MILKLPVFVMKFPRFVALSIFCDACLTYRVNFLPSYTTVASGSYTDAKGKTHIKRTKIAELTNGITVQEY